MVSSNENALQVVRITKSSSSQPPHYAYAPNARRNTQLDLPRPKRLRAGSFSPRENALIVVPVLRKRTSWPPSQQGRNRTEKPPRAPLRPRILFYHRHDPHYGFTNFSAHPVVYRDKRYPTSEHLFQSFKFQDHRPNLAEHIRLCCTERPSVALSEARRFQPEVRPDWLNVNIAKMDETLFLKFSQHPDLKRELISTGNAELVEDSDKDSFWGIGADGHGRNELGKALERLRRKLRKEV